jgi:4'-phosphopantetheinyl transferase
VYWLEQTQADVPAENDWLSARESVCLSGLRFAKRRADWRLGRWTAKCAVASFLNLSMDAQDLAQIEIRPASSGAPEIFIANEPAAVAVSISHSSGAAVCAVAKPGVELGCDQEVIEARSDAFVADYFTESEQVLVARVCAAERSRLVTLLWSAKESALKALREGLRLDTRSVTVSPINGGFNLNGWSPLQVRYADGRTFHGWWQQGHGMVRTLVANPPPDSPILLLRPLDFLTARLRADRGLVYGCADTFRWPNSVPSPKRG